MTWHKYEIEKSASSMDGLQRISEWKAQLADDIGVAGLELLDVELADALDAARAAGWTDARHGEPRIFVLPNVADFQFGLVWTDTRTVILSPLALPWMEAQLTTQAG